MYIRLACLTIGLVAATGCNGTGGGANRDGPTASAVRDPIIADLPKPSGFRLVDERSVARASGQFRVAKCEYMGGTHRDAVVRFYEEYMPAAGFELKHKSFYNGEFELRFESDAEHCVVNVRPRGGQTTLVIDVGPKSAGSAERDAAPPMRRPRPRPNEE